MGGVASPDRGASGVCWSSHGGGVTSSGAPGDGAASSVSDYHAEGDHPKALLSVGEGCEPSGEGRLCGCFSPSAFGSRGSSFSSNRCYRAIRCRG